MGEIRNKLTVLFEDPFWIGIIERIENGKISVCKITFGAEPKDYEVYNFIERHYYKLKFSPAVKTDVKLDKKNPKKMQRDINKSLKNSGIGTKSQQALKLQQEQNKLERKIKTKAEREAEKERLFILKQQKKKEKHRGR